MNQVTRHRVEETRDYLKKEDGALTNIVLNRSLNAEQRTILRVARKLVADAIKEINAALSA